MDRFYDEKPRSPRKEAVKSFAIVFLAVMLVLTFFSNTIMNWSLPQVNGSYSSYGAIATAVRGSGIVQSNMEYNVTSPTTNKIANVFVGRGSFVNKGDILLEFEKGDSEELSAAKDTLASLRDQLNALTNKTLDYTDAELAIATAEKALEDLKFDRALDADGYSGISVNDAKLAVRAAQQEYDKLAEAVAEVESRIEAELNSEDNSLIKSRRKQLKTAQDNLKAAQAEVEEQQAKLDAMYDSNGDLMPGITVAMVNSQSQVVINARASLSYYQNAIDTAQAQLDSAIAEVSGYLNTELEEAKLWRDDAKKVLDDAKEELALAQTIADYDSRITASERALANQKKQLEEQKKQDASLSESDKRKIESLNLSISKQNELISKLESGEANYITANYSGTITSFNAIPGDTLQAGASVCVIEVADKGYTVSFSVSAEQAQRLSPGDKATVSGTYWGQSAEANLVSAKIEAGGRTRTLTFEISGDVTPGQNVTVSVGERSSYYDSIVPKNAVHEDADGTFVLVARAKSTPLGTRYYAERVPCTVLDKDEKNAAIATDESYFYEFVITSSTAPISEGDYVRLSDK